MKTDLPDIPHSPNSEAEARTWIELLQSDETGEVHLRWLKLEALMGSDSEQLDESACVSSGARPSVWRHFDPLRAPIATAGFREWHVTKQWLTEVHDPACVFEDAGRSFAHAVIHGNFNGVIDALSTEGFECGPFDLPAWVLHGALKILLESPEAAEQFPEKVAFLLRAVWFRDEANGFDIGNELCQPGEVGERLGRFIKNHEATLSLTQFTSEPSSAQQKRYLSSGLRSDGDNLYDLHKRVQYAELSKIFPTAVALVWLIDEEFLPDELLSVWPGAVKSMFDILEGLGQEAWGACLNAWKQHRAVAIQPAGLPAIEGPLQ